MRGLVLNFLDRSHERPYTHYVIILVGLTYCDAVVQTLTEFAEDILEGSTFTRLVPVVENPSRKSLNFYAL